MCECWCSSVQVSSRLMYPPVAKKTVCFCLRSGRRSYTKLVVCVAIVNSPHPGFVLVSFWVKKLLHLQVIGLLAYSLKLSDCGNQILAQSSLNWLHGLAHSFKWTEMIGLMPWSTFEWHLMKVILLYKTIWCQFLEVREIGDGFWARFHVGRANNLHRTQKLFIIN